MSNQRQPDIETITLRGHHLLCVLGFRGLGYSEAFVENMQSVVDRLRADPLATLRLLDSKDAICTACPHDSPNGCAQAEDSEARLRARDRGVLKALGLSPGDEISVASAYALVRERIAEEALAQDLCKGCDWLEGDYCSEGLRQLKAFEGAGIP